MKDIIDIIFKVCIVLLLGAFVYFYMSHSTIGRYQFSSKNPRIILDTKTGQVYKNGQLWQNIGQNNE